MEPTRYPPQDRAARLAIAAGLAVLLIPILRVPVPPLVDYPNHLARLWIISGEASGGFLSDVYEVDWSLAVTNIGIDLLARLLGPLVGAEAAGRFGVALALILPVAGTVLLGRAIGGHWHIALAGIPLLAWTMTFAAGFLNNQIAIGAALLVAAAFAARGARGAILLGAGAAAVGIIHLAGAAFLAGLAAAIALGPEVPRGRWGAAIRRAAAACLPVVLATAALLLLAPMMPGQDPRVVATAASWSYRADFKLLALVSPFLTYSFLPEAAFGLGLLAVVAFCVRTGRLRLHFGLYMLTGALLLISLVMPSQIGDTQVLDLRFAGMAALTLAAALLPGPAPRPLAAVAIAVALMLIGVGRTLWVLSHWESAARDIAAVERALEALPRGSVLLPVVAGPQQPAGRRGQPRLIGAWPLHTHYAARTVVLRDSFIPTLFAFAGRQPVRVRAPWHRLSVPDGHPPALEDLARALQPQVQAAFPYLADWQADFDFLLLLDARGGANLPLPERLELLADEGFARLYRIRSHHAGADMDEPAQAPPAGSGH